MDNAIAIRLARLAEQWREFAEVEHLRALHWLVDADEWRMLDTFFVLESLESAASDDVFLRVDVGFDDGTRHGLVMRQWLEEEYAKAAPGLDDAGVVIGWTAPPPVADDVASLAATLESLWRHHQPIVRHLVVVLEPKHVHDGAKWIAWLDRLLAALPRIHVRVILVDRVDTAALAPVAKRHAAIVRSVVAALDMPRAYVELSADAGGLDTPQGRFRHAFVQMSEQLSHARMDEASQHAREADRIAQSQKWTHLQFAVAYAMASGHLGREDHRAAIAGYRDAERLAMRVHDEGEPFGLGLRLKAMLAQGACCIAAGAFPAGAERYDAAGVVADQIDDTRMRLETRRMAAYCYEQAKDDAKAWGRGVDAIAIGALLSEADRKTSTLAAAGVALMRVASTPGAIRFGGSAPAVESRMRELLGPDWRSKDVQDAA